MPLQATSGAASYDAFGGGVAAVPQYIEDAFSCFLYTGTSANQIITNNINLSNDGGLVWVKGRSSATAHALFDTNRGVQKFLQSNTTDAEGTASTSLTAFFADGFRVGADSLVNESGETYVSWSLKKQPKFFDVVTYTGTGANRTVDHALGSVPGCIIVKRTNTTGDWQVYHRANTANPETDYLVLNTTAATQDSNTRWNDTLPTSTVFSLGTEATVNASGSTYVAYLFAHDSGGFGLTGTDNVISCGSFTADGSGAATVDLGYEPQFLILKNTSTTGSWLMQDVMRGFSQTYWSRLLANLANAESNLTGNYIYPTATGFDVSAASLSAGSTYIYIAIRRGPMKVPTTGTSVYTGAWFQDGNVQTETNFPVDLAIEKYGYKNDSQVNVTGSNWFYDRLRGVGRLLVSNSTAAETTSPPAFYVSGFDSNTTLKVASSNITGSSGMFWSFRRAPGFFDEAIVTTNGQTAPITSNHNLGVIPEMMIAKKREATGDWMVYHSGLNGGVTPQNFRIRLNSTGAAGASSGVWNNTAPTATQFTIGTDGDVNSGTAGQTTVFYLFASAPGVSKVGSYTGTGSTQTINCGFTGGARFVLIKATSTTGNWLVWDSARGIVAGNDPYLVLNSTAAEVTNTDWVDTAATGFELSNAGGNLANSSGVSYIFLAIA
jgi:hypothetical protein